MTKMYSLMQAIMWRIVASTDTLAVSYYFTGDLAAAGSIASIEVLTKMVLYYYHERGWNWYLSREKILDKIPQLG